MAFGLSFLPGLGGENGDERNGRTLANPHQRAVQLLSLRLPRVLGGSALAPAPLLQGQGGAGSPFARSALFQTQQQQAAAPVLSSSPGGGLTPVMQALLQMSGMGSARLPSRNTPRLPRVIPGLVGPEGVNGPLSPEWAGPNAPDWQPPADFAGPAAAAWDPSHPKFHLPAYQDDQSYVGSGEVFRDKFAFLDNLWEAARRGL